MFPKADLFKVSTLGWGWFKIDFGKFKDTEIPRDFKEGHLCFFRKINKKI